MSTGLRANTWYNKEQPYGLAGYINDFSSRMIGYAALRQLRVKNSKNFNLKSLIIYLIFNLISFRLICSLYGKMNELIHHCTNELSNGGHQDEQNYGFGWSQFNFNYTPPYGYQSMFDSFQFKDAHTLQGSSIQGKSGAYDGSGYLYEIRGQLSYIQGNMSLLKEMNWIDRQTRVIFVEFSVYNPNINLVMVSTILIEFLSSGTILTSFQFDPLNLFNESNGITFITFCEILLLVFFFYYLFRQFKEMRNKDLKEYFQDFWTYIEWSIIISGFVSFALILVRLKKAYEVLDFFKATSGFGYIKLQIANECNQYLTYSLGLCSTFGTIKFLKLLRFNKNIGYLGKSLKMCLNDLMSFSIVFFLIWISFVQLMHLMFGNYLEGYSSFIKSMENAFQILLGKNNANQFISISPILGPVLFAGFFLANVCFSLNIFVSIITNAFDEVRLERKKDETNKNFFDYTWTKLKNLFGNNRRHTDTKPHCEYRDHLSILPKHVNRLINFLYRVIDFFALNVEKLLNFKISIFFRIWTNLSSNWLLKMKVFRVLGNLNE